MPTDEQRITPDVLRDMARAADYKPLPANQRYQNWEKNDPREGTKFVLVPSDEPSGDYESLLQRAYRQLSRDPDYLLSEVRSREAEIQALREALEHADALMLKAAHTLTKQHGDADAADPLLEAVEQIRHTLAGRNTP